MKDQWFTCDIREEIIAEAHKGNVVQNLDAHIFGDKVLADILGITD